MLLIAILAATLAAGVGSVWVAGALLRLGVAGRGARVQPQHLLSLAAGALLATAFMHLLPEAFESGIPVERLFATLLAGVMFFFLLDKAELWHHGHEHGGGPARAGDEEAAGGHEHGHRHGHEHDHDHDHDHDHGGHAHHRGAEAGHRAQDAPAPGGAWALLTGDSVHCIGDGVLIASAFAAGPALGAVAALAVLAHEVPHHMGDLIVLGRSTATRRAALGKVSVAGATTVLGGLAGHFLVAQLGPWLPYFLVVASSSFLYVALADLVPQLQQRLSARQTVAQLAWLAAGIVLVTVASRLAHGHHGHDHPHGHEHEHEHEASPAPAAAPRP